MDGKQTLILGLTWKLIAHFSEGMLTEAGGMELQSWVGRNTAGYGGVDVAAFDSRSFGDGMALWSVASSAPSARRELSRRTHPVTRASPAPRPRCRSRYTRAVRSCTSTGRVRSTLSPSSPPTASPTSNSPSRRLRRSAAHCDRLGVEGARACMRVRRPRPRGRPFPLVVVVVVVYRAPE